MKRLISACFAVALITMPLPEAKAAVGVAVFYETLQPYGEWIEAGEYGYCWRPNDTNEDWQPYTDGNWAYTDAGWTWVSDEPYGWAVYHYGRWAKMEDLGWVWVPDTEWGPAWVSWRRSKRHVGWAPLPPEARFRGETRSISHWSDSYYDIGPSSYSFVEVRDFGAPRLRAVVIQPRENLTIINETTNITNITVQNNVVFNGGPDFDVIGRESAQPIRRLRIERQTTFAGGDPRSIRPETLQTRVENNALRIFAPPIESSVAVAPPQVSRKLEHVQVNRGWKEIADQTQVEKLRQKMKVEAPVPATLPPKPKFDRVIASKAAAPQTAATAAPATPPTPPATPMPETGNAKISPTSVAPPQTRPGKTDSRNTPKPTTRPGTVIAPEEIPTQMEPKPAITEKKPTEEGTGKPPIPAAAATPPKSMDRERPPVVQPRVKKDKRPVNIPQEELPTKAPSPATLAEPTHVQVPPPAPAAPVREKKRLEPAAEVSRREAAPIPQNNLPERNAPIAHPPQNPGAEHATPERKNLKREIPPPESHERPQTERPSGPVSPAQPGRPAPSDPPKKEKKNGDKDSDPR